MPPALAPILVAPDSFKGTLTATEVAAALARGVEAAGRPADRCPVADGGEGTAAVLAEALGGAAIDAEAHDPLGRPIKATFAALGDGATAVVEVAAASGLALLAPGERDAEAASSTGTGELILAAVASGAHTVLVAAGGSATTDGGAGAIEAIEAGGGLGDARLVVLCDVRTPWERAAASFAPQKGADEAAVTRLEQRLDALAGQLPRDPRGVAFTGAAGGLSGGLWVRFDARLEPGAAHVLAALDVDVRMRAARAVIVGEGRLDRTSLQGKVTAELATRARQGGIPCAAVTGANALPAFEQRILDLQVVLEAGDLAALEAAGRELTELM